MVGSEYPGFYRRDVQGFAVVRAPLADVLHILPAEVLPARELRVAVEEHVVVAVHMPGGVVAIHTSAVAHPGEFSVVVAEVALMPDRTATGGKPAVRPTVQAVPEDGETGRLLERRLVPPRKVGVLMSQTVFVVGVGDLSPAVWNHTFGVERIGLVHRGV